MIRIKNLNKHFKDRIIFENLNLELPNIGLVAILGDSGSGKTTLLNMLSGIDFDYEGSIEIDYQNLKRIKKKDVGLYRLKNIGFVFQNFSLINLDTVNQNIRLPLESISNNSNKKLDKRVDDVLDIVDLKIKKNERVNNLSEYSLVEMGLFGGEGDEASEIGSGIMFNYKTFSTWSISDTASLTVIWRIFF